MKKYVIIPGCSDLNRGDQALVWETKRLAEDAGFLGEYYLTSEKNEPVNQSKEHGIKIVTPILEHPSRMFKSKENIIYTKTLKIKWGIVAFFDLINSLLLLVKPFRKIMKKTIDRDKATAISIMEDADAFFMKGGGLLQTYGGLSSTYSMYFFVYPLLFARSLKKPVYIMPNSYGPFEGPFVKKIARTALRTCVILTSRETYSQKMVEEQLGLKIDNYPDLAFALSKSEMDIAKLYEQYDFPYDRKLVAITMRPYRFPGTQNPKKAYDTFKKEMALFIDWLFEQGYMPIVIEHTLAVNAHENDGACIKEVLSMVDKRKYRFVADKNYNCQDLKTIYSICDYIVGTRFHSVIFSFGSNVPGIAIAYTGNKAQGIMHDIGLDEYIVNLEDVSCNQLIEKFISLEKNRESVIEKIKKYRINAEEKRKCLINACRRTEQ